MIKKIVLYGAIALVSIGGLISLADHIFGKSRMVGFTSKTQIPVYAMIYRLDEQAGFTNAGWTDTEFTGGSVVSQGITHSTSTNPAQITVDQDGLYEISYMVNGFCNSNVHTTYARLLVNNSTEILGSGTVLSTGASYAFVLEDTVIVELNANDYFTLQGRTDNAAASDWDGEANLDTPVAAQIVIKRIDD